MEKLLVLPTIEPGSSVYITDAQLSVSLIQERSDWPVTEARSSDLIGLEVKQSNVYEKMPSFPTIELLLEKREIIEIPVLMF